MTVAAAIAAWLGASLILLSDGARGLALGLLVIAAGLGGIAAAGGHAPEAVALAAGGVVAAVLCLRTRPSAWGIMPPGSTPRLLLSIVAGLLSLWLTATVTSGPDAALRFALPATLALLTVRVLLGAHPAAAAAAASAAALAVGAAALLAGPGAMLAACVVAGAAAAGIQAIPRPEADGA